MMLAWEFPPRITGGLGVACAGLAGALRTRVDLTLCLPDDPAGDPYASGDDYQGDLWRRVRDFSDKVAAEPGEYDLIHAHDWLTVPAAAELARRTGLPVVFHLHSLELDRSGERNRIFLVERSGMRIAHRVIVVSRYTSGICERSYGISRNKIRVVWNGIGTTGAPAAGPRPAKVVFIGRMTAQKAPEDFVRMAARVSAAMPEAEFVMVGQGELLDAVRGLAAELGLEGAIRFPGFLERGQVMAELAGAAVLCVPSRSEPFGMVALEAAVQAVPAVMTDHCGVREVLPSAAVVPVGDVEAMAGAVVRLLRDAGLRGRSGREAREEAGRVPWEVAAKRVVEVYREVLGGGTPPSRVR